MNGPLHRVEALYQGFTLLLFSFQNRICPCLYSMPPGCRYRYFVHRLTSGRTFFCYAMKPFLLTGICSIQRSAARPSELRLRLRLAARYDPNGRLRRARMVLSESGNLLDHPHDVSRGDQAGALELPRRAGMPRAPQEVGMVESQLRIAPASVARVPIDDAVGRVELGRR
jgi:hypothetical protein